MIKINTGGPAFPLHPRIQTDWKSSAGMTVRDLVALEVFVRLATTDNDYSYKECAEYSFLAADTFLDAREVQP